MAILIKDDQSIEKIAIAGTIISKIFSAIRAIDLCGMTTLQLDERISSMIKEHGGIPTFFQYRGFPKHCCISLNDQVVHGIPDDRTIKKGDLVKVDVGVTYNGYIADAATTIAVGDITDDVQRLIDTTKQALRSGIAQAQKGKHISNISMSIQTVVEEQGFNVIRELTGHGVGHSLHEEPTIPNFVCNAPDPKLDAGMVLAIEPMVTMGDYPVVTEANGWTITTQDGSLSAHFEDTIVITKRGNMNVTRVVES
jgi:methionyl aminopeptidase